jgi:hypothetical protein
MAIPTFVDRVTLHVAAGRGGDHPRFALPRGGVFWGKRRARRVIKIVRADA